MRLKISLQQLLLFIQTPIKDSFLWLQKYTRLFQSSPESAKSTDNIPVLLSAALSASQTVNKTRASDRPVAYMNLECSAARRGLWLTDINWKPQGADQSNNITKEMNKYNDKNVLWQRFLGGETLSFIRRSISLMGSFINTCLPWSQNPTGMSFTPDSIQTLRLSNRVV